MDSNRQLTIREDAYLLIDNFIERLVAEKSISVFNIDRRHDSKKAIYALDIMDKYGLITYKKGYREASSIVDITLEGYEVWKLGGIKNYLSALAEKEAHENYVKNIELEKTKYDIELSSRILKDYPRTRLFALISIIISFLLSVYAVIDMLGLL